MLQKLIITKHKFNNQTLFAGALFLILCSLYLVFDLIGNEEVQLTFAKAFIDQDWPRQNSVYDDFAGTRLLIRIIAGSLLIPFDWITVGVLLRLINFIIFSIVLSRIFEKIGLSILQGMVCLLLFSLTPQSLIGDEWIFGGFEAKTFAYCAILGAIYFFIDKKYFLAILLCCIATYFHVLVGFWFCLTLLLYCIINTSIIETIKLGIIYSLSITPLLIYVFIGNIDASYPDNFNLSEYYVYTRVPHHTGIFYNYSIFSLKSIGIVLSIINLIFLYKIKYDGSNKERIRILNFIIQCLILVFILIAALDYYLLDKSLSPLLATYPLRQSSLSLFLSFVLITTRINFDSILKTRIAWATTILILISFISFNIYRTVNPIGKSDSDFNKVVEFAKTNTQIDSSFFY